MQFLYLLILFHQYFSFVFYFISLSYYNLSFIYTLHIFTPNIHVDCQGSSFDKAISQQDVTMIQIVEWTP